MSIASHKYITVSYHVNLYTIQILDLIAPQPHHSSSTITMAQRVTATTLNDSSKPTATDIKPDSIVQMHGRTYINMQPLNNVPAFPAAFAPAAMDLDGFLPVDPDGAFQQGYVDGMTNINNLINAWPQWPATGSMAATEQCWQWLQT